MTKQETFKRRVRARMEKTGERYAAARRTLIDRAASNGPRVWVSQPESSDEVIRENTGRGWDEWCDLIDAWPGHTEGHPAIARWVNEQHGVPGWWAQAVTVGYERITGLRLPYQRPDGSFSASKSRTVTVDVEGLRALLLDDDDRTDLFPGVETELRSKATTKALRFGIGPGVAIIDLEALDDGRVKVSVAHERLPSVAAVDEWKAYWSDWLDAVDTA
jgi:hypothetical protein